MKKLWPALMVFVLGVVLVWAIGGARRRAAANPNGEDGSVVERLRAELAAAPAPAGRTDADRVADAAAWVRTNRPAGWPYAALEARVLAGYDARAHAEPRSVAWALDMSRQELEWVRALDADLDGRVSEEEIAGLAAVSREFLDPTTHPYLVSVLDDDGNGMIDDRYLEGLYSTEAERAGLLERAQTDLWDTDGDGLLSEAERAAGRAGSLSHQVLFPDGHTEYTATPAEDWAAAQEAVLEEMAEQFGERSAELARSRLDSAVDMQLSMSLSQDTQLIEPDTERFIDAPVFPDLAEFDPDGDNQLDDAQLAAFEEARLAWEESMREWQAVEGARRAARQFERLTEAGDADGNGVLDEGEWSDLINGRVEDRTRRLTLRSYDEDGSGAIELGEIETYLEWFRAGSIRADTNFDGLINGADIEALLVYFQNNGG